MNLTIKTKKYNSILYGVGILAAFAAGVLTGFAIDDFDGFD